MCAFFCLVLSLVGAMVSAGMVELDVNMSNFLSRHGAWISILVLGVNYNIGHRSDSNHMQMSLKTDMTWEWEWGARGAYTLQPIASEFSFCGKDGTKGDCCLGILPGSSVVGLQHCDPSQLAQQWKMTSNGSVINAQNLQCLTTASSGWHHKHSLPVRLTRPMLTFDRKSCAVVLFLGACPP